MKQEELNEYKNLLEKDMELLGYQALRYSLFAGKLNNRQEYQLRLEHENDKFQVYMTNERAWEENKYESDDYHKAKLEFLQLVQLTVLINRKAVSKGEKPEYSSPLWDKPE